MDKNHDEKIFFSTMKGLSKPAVLAALYNAAGPQGATVRFYDPKPMTIQEATEILANDPFPRYIKGRLIRVDFSRDDELLYTGWYDRDNGDAMADLVMISLRRTGDVNNEYIREWHQDALRRALNAAHPDDSKN